jgi:O-antigen/teichoic acid export membrane protein
LKLADSLAKLLPQHILGPGLISLVIKLAGAVLAYGMVVAFAHLMSAEEYGRFAFGLNLAIVTAAVSGFGFSTGIMRYWPKYIVAEDQAGARGVVELGYRSFLLSCFVLIFIEIATSFVSSIFQIKSPVAEMAAIGCFGLIISLNDYSGNLLRAQGSVIISMLPREVLWRVFSVLSVSLLVWFGIAVSSLVALVICTIVLAVLTIWQIVNVRKYMVEKFSASGSRRDWNAIRNSIIPLWATGIVYAMIQQLDVIVVSAYTQPKEAGAYFAAQKTAGLLSLVMIAGGLVGAPLMSAKFHNGKLKEVQQLCTSLAAVIAITTFFGFLILIFFGRQLLGMFNQDFMSAYPVLMVLASAYTIDALAGPNAYLMQMTSLETSYLKIMACCYCGVLLSQIILVPIYGGMGAALANAGGVVAWNVWAIYLLRKRQKLDPSILGIFFNPQKAL